MEADPARSLGNGDQVGAATVAGPTFAIWMSELDQHGYSTVGIAGQLPGQPVPVDP